MRERARFLNVDLDLKSRAEITPLIEALKPSVMVLHQGQRRATLELLKQPASAEQAVRQFINQVEGLSPPIRAVWQRCTRRVLSIGLQSGSTPHQLVIPLAPTVLSRLAILSLGIEIVMYAVPRTE